MDESASLRCLACYLVRPPVSLFWFTEGPFLSIAQFLQYRQIMTSILTIKETGTLASGGREAGEAEISFGYVT